MTAFSFPDLRPGDVLVITDPDTPFVGALVTAVIIQKQMVLARGHAPGLDGEEVMFVAWFGFDQFSVDAEKTAIARDRNRC